MTLVEKMQWTKSSLCESNGCVEAMSDGGEWVFVRASQEPGHMMRFTEAEWRDFVAGVKNGDFDL